MPSRELIEAPPQAVEAGLSSALAFAPLDLDPRYELEALRIALRDREATIATLREALEERDTALEWREHEARSATVEAAAARRESLQYREDRDYTRRQLQLRVEEVSNLIVKFRAERARAIEAEHAVEVLESSLRPACEQLEQELGTARLQLSLANAAIDQLTAETERLQGNIAAEIVANATAKQLEADLVRRLLEKPPQAVVSSADKTAEWTEIARLRAQVASLKGELTAAGHTPEV